VTSWEYTSFSRWRGFKGSLSGRHEATDWDHSITSEMIQLGKEGWELVAVVPRSGIAGEDSSGFTSEELWVFKRPAQDA
jgi:hypothetical protein